MDIHAISERFRIFANRECKGSSKLYEKLSLKIAEDEDLLHIATHSRNGQPIPNLFLGAVHYLLLKDMKHELVKYYSSIVNDPSDPEMAFNPFKDFCLLHTDAMIDLLKNKLVQTNEVRRCTYLYPSFCYIYEMTKRPLALIEIGTSAGLQLLWDKYCYSYNADEIYGDHQSKLRLISEIKSQTIPTFKKHSPPVATRIGIDLHINDLKNPEHYLWLKALIWPEHKERLMNFEEAVNCMRGHSVDLIEGNGVKLITEVASRIPREYVVCVFHTHVANQMSQADKCELTNRIQKLGAERDVFHLYNNMWDLNHLHLDYYLKGENHNLTLAETDGHGQWFQWNL